MKPELRILHTNLVYTNESRAFVCRERAYLVLENGTVEGVYDVLPDRFPRELVEDCTNAFLVPSFCDLHLHAPQYPRTGMGMDLELLEWLNTYAFPGEAQFRDPEYARSIYRLLAAQLVSKGTTRVCMFSSLHREATLILMEELENAGITGYVGKVNMDRNSPDYLREGKEAISETRRWIEESLSRFTYIKPILTPRFIPSCTDELMRGLGELKREYHLHAQSHLSENRDEVKWVRELHPDCKYYYQAYEKYGLFGEGDVMAHCVLSDETERKAIRECGVTVAHCPDSNINITTGIAPVRKMLSEGLSVGIGTDIAGGSSLSMMDALTLSVKMSKVKYLESGRKDAPLTFSEAFHLAAGEGAKFFGARADFSKGQKLHALLLSDEALPHAKEEFPLPVRLERIVYNAEDRLILKRFSEGREI